MVLVKKYDLNNKANVLDNYQILEFQCNDFLWIRVLHFTSISLYNTKIFRCKIKKWPKFNSIILNDLSLPVTLHIVMRNLLPMQPDPCLKNIYKNARYKKKNKT